MISLLSNLKTNKIAQTVFVNLDWIHCIYILY